jgi:hypothetical protein
VSMSRPVKPGRLGKEESDLNDDGYAASEVLWEDGERILCRKRRNGSEGNRNSVLVVSRPHIATGKAPQTNTMVLWTAILP